MRFIDPTNRICICDTNASAGIIFYIHIIVFTNIQRSCTNHNTGDIVIDIVVVQGNRTISCYRCGHTNTITVASDCCVINSQANPMRAAPLSGKSNNSLAHIVLDCAPGDITHNIPVAGIQMDTLFTIADRTSRHGNVVISTDT